MPEQAGDIIKDALTEITALGAEASLEASDAQTAMRYLNRLMASLDAKGIPLGYTEVSSTADLITVPAGAIEGMVFLLAVRLWTQYSDGAPPPPALVANAVSGLNAMVALAVTIGSTEFPGTLPVGSGNAGGSIRGGRFYTDLESTILAESTGSIGLEELT